MLMSLVRTQVGEPKCHFLSLCALKLAHRRWVVDSKQVVDVRNGPRSFGLSPVGLTRSEKRFMPSQYKENKENKENKESKETCPSGQRALTRNQMAPQGAPGFESLRFRQKASKRSARMAKLVDAPALKVDALVACGFEPRFAHHKTMQTMQRIFSL